MSRIVGIDIGKAWLDVDALGKLFRLQNNRAGFAELLRRSRPPRGDCCYVCESGSYGRALIKYLHDQEAEVCVVSPLRVRQFGYATGAKAKTDRLDASLIKRFAATLKPPRSLPVERWVERLRAIMRRRQQIVDIARNQKNQKEYLQGKRFRNQAEQIIELLAEQADSLFEEALRVINQRSALRRKMLVLLSTVGVGEICGVQLLAEMPELGRLNRREVAALAGLAPYNNDSGARSGKRSIHGGRGYARRALFMAAFHASRINPILAAFYDRLVRKGKPRRVCRIAVMRKLLVYLNARIRESDAGNDVQPPPKITPSLIRQLCKAKVMRAKTTV